MEFLKKYGYWIGVGAAVLGAVVFYVLAVQGQKGVYAKKLEEVRQLASAIKAQDKGDQTPNQKWTEREKKYAELVEAEISKVEKIIVVQRRNNFTKLFWPDDSPTQESVSDRTTWIRLYDRHVAALRQQMAEAGIGASLSFESYTQLPSWPRIRNEQIYFWLCKDIVDLLTNRAEKDVELELKEYWTPSRSSLKTLFDVLKNPEPQRLSNALQALPKEKLAAALTDILTNPTQEDLVRILRKHDIFSIVEEMTSSGQQRDFVAYLGRPAGKDRSDLVRFLDDLRWVRFREDLVALFRDQPSLADLGRKLHDWGPATPKIIAEDLRGDNWRPLRLAQAIEAAVAISTERDLKVLLRNHLLNWARVDALTISKVAVFEDSSAPSGVEARGGRPGEAGMARPMGLAGVYNSFPFTIGVTIEFRHIPVLVRRLLMSDWRIEVLKINVTRVGPIESRPAGVPAAGAEGAEPGPAAAAPAPPPPSGLSPVAAGRGGRGGRAAPPGAQPPVGAPPGGAQPPVGAPPGGAPVVRAPETQSETIKGPVVPSNYVRVDLECEARQFYPLWAKLNPEEAKKIEERYSGKQ
ncbi:MAG TPA: hypothetical protein P5137_16770 [Candidatus Brocadiia bacterium]|nr:hypothetical protein [Candidatus Brocadiia bacterium]